jgi:hypothetical protein
VEDINAISREKSIPWLPEELIERDLIRVKAQVALRQAAKSGLLT